MNIHNWTDKFVDGLLANDRCMAEGISSFMPADTGHFKCWYIQTSEDYCNGLRKRGEYSEKAVRLCKSWKNYCQDKFGAFGVNFEFPWFNLTPQAMREKGVLALQSFALSVIRETKI